MKKIISILLIAALLYFLCMTNPTTKEFAVWYADQTEFLETGTFLDDASLAFAEHLAMGAARTDYLICSIFTFNNHKTLGVGLMFFPVDSLNAQMEDLRSSYADWLSSGQN